MDEVRDKAWDMYKLMWASDEVSDKAQTETNLKKETQKMNDKIGNVYYRFKIDDNTILTNLPPPYKFPWEP